MVNVTGFPGPDAFVCSLLVWALGLLIFYWVIRLAVRHALTDVGVRRLVHRSYAEEDERASADSTPDDDQYERPQSE